MPNLRIAELDFDTIKTNLKNFLKDQTEFSDYDFEGSALSTLIDLLAYNTHYNAYLANMVINETFLDSAVKRTSAVSIAKHFGYTPRSVRSAKATISVNVNPGVGSPASTLTMERFTTFTTVIDGTTLNFLTTIPYTALLSGTTYLFSNVEVTEGQQIEYRYTSSNPSPSEKFEIPSSNIDTSTLRVIVQNSSSDTTQTVFSLYSDLSSVQADSLIYYLEENNNGKYQVFFGDNILGKKLSAGNIVILQYLVSSGIDGNVSNLVTQNFSLSGTVSGYSNVTVTTVNNSTGGADKETLDEIKFNATRQFLAQDRAITASDYKSIIQTSFPAVESIAVWGGEDNVPPIYGKVIVALKPYLGYEISNITKQDIRSSILKSRKSLGIQIEFVDPEYLYVNLIITVYYNSRLTNLSASSLTSQISTTIENYFNNNLEKFDADFYVSKLTTLIDNISTSITGTNITVNLQKRIEPVLNVSNSFSGTNSVRFYHKLHPYEITSTRFNIIISGVVVPAIIEDSPNDTPINYNGTGTLVLKNPDSGVTLSTNIGQVNYATGEITIDNIIPVGYPTGQLDLRITAETQEEDNNIIVNREQIVVLDDSTLNPLSNRLQGLTINVVDISQ